MNRVRMMLMCALCLVGLSVLAACGGDSESAHDAATSDATVLDDAAVARDAADDVEVVADAGDTDGAIDAQLDDADLDASTMVDPDASLDGALIEDAAVDAAPTTTHVRFADFAFEDRTHAFTFASTTGALITGVVAPQGTEYYEFPAEESALAIRIGGDTISEPLAVSTGATLENGKYYTAIAYLDSAATSGVALVLIEDVTPSAGRFSWTHFNAAESFVDAQTRIVPNATLDVIPTASPFGVPVRQSYRTGVHRIDADFDGDNVFDRVTGGDGAHPIAAGTLWISVFVERDGAADWYLLTLEGLVRVEGNSAQIRGISVVSDDHSELPISLFAQPLGGSSWSQLADFSSATTMTATSATAFADAESKNFWFRWTNSDSALTSVLASTLSYTNAGYRYNVILNDHISGDHSAYAASVFSQDPYFISPDRARVDIASVFDDYSAPHVLQVVGISSPRWCDIPIDSRPCTPEGDLEMGTYTIAIDLDHDEHIDENEPMYLFEVGAEMLGKNTLMLLHGYDDAADALPRLYVVYEDGGAPTVIEPLI